MQASRSIGFIGLGAMGEPMCRHLAIKSGIAVRAFDREVAPLERLARHGVQAADSASDAARDASFVFLCLPSGEVVRQVLEGAGGLLSSVQSGQVIIDMSTSAVDLTRDLAAKVAARGATFIDAPVARTSEAAEAGTLSIMVGADVETFSRVEPLLTTFASEITHCGPVGCGQVVKILNNMVMFEAVVALAEAKAIGERAGVPADLLFEALAKGSADSFSLRVHGMNAMVPDRFPEGIFSVIYARKDLSYALRLAEQTGVSAQGASNVDAWYQRAIDAGLGESYHPVISRLFGK